MRRFFLLFALLLGACEGSFFRPEHLGRRVSYEKSYEARDACLVRNANADAGSSESSENIAHAVAMACAAETDRLIQAANRGDSDPKVAAAIRQDTEFRAVKYVMRAQGRSLH